MKTGLASSGALAANEANDNPESHFRIGSSLSSNSVIVILSPLFAKIFLEIFEPLNTDSNALVSAIFLAANELNIFVLLAAGVGALNKLLAATPKLKLLLVELPKMLLLELKLFPMEPAVNRPEEGVMEDVNKGGAVVVTAGDENIVEAVVVIAGEANKPLVAAGDENKPVEIVIAGDENISDEVVAMEPNRLFLAGEKLNFVIVSETVVLAAGDENKPVEIEIAGDENTSDEVVAMEPNRLTVAGEKLNFGIVSETVVLAAAAKAFAGESTAGFNKNPPVLGEKLNEFFAVLTEVSLANKSFKYSSSFLHCSHLQSGNCLYDKNFGGRPNFKANCSSSGVTCVSDTITTSSSSDFSVDPANNSNVIVVH